MAGKLIMTKGLPGSGKTTWAQAQGATIVCKDDIRAEQFKKDWNYDVEKEVLRVRDFRIGQGLSKGLTVISADTNLAHKHEARLRELAKKWKASFEVKDFTSVPIATCVERDAQREDTARVGEKVIRDMAEKFLDCSELIGRTGNPQLFCDLDGVLADFDGFLEREFGIENNRENERPDLWDVLRGYGGRLYFDVDPLPGATKLWASLKPYRPIILTGVPWSIPTAAQDKREWVAKYIDPHVEVVTCRARSKSLYMKPGDVLLDDWEKHKKMWESKGGVWITYDGDVDTAIEQVQEVMSGEI